MPEWRRTSSGRNASATLRAPDHTRFGRTRDAPEAHTATVLLRLLWSPDHIQSAGEVDFHKSHACEPTSTTTTPQSLI
jgi:hypothetical protein